jgi:hypothetical protein
MVDGGWWMGWYLLGLGESHPHDEDELEGVVEWEPVSGVDHGLDDGGEGVDDPVLPISHQHPTHSLLSVVSMGIGTYGEPLRIIRLAGREDGLHGPVGREHEASGVDEELAGDVEEDEEEVEGAETEHDVDLGDGGLRFEVVERWVLGELPACC